MPKTVSCRTPQATAAHTRKVERALRTRHDVWGNALLNAPDGPSYEAARRLLPPLLYARAPGKRPLTESGVYYVPFGQPLGARGAGSVALHVADGSQVIAERVGGRRLTVFVGAKGGERYGSCLARLGQARLAAGYLPIMSTTYTDAARVRYRQESFAAQTSETGSLVSFIRLDVDATRASAKVVQLRLKPSVKKLRQVLAFSRGGTVKRSVLTYRIKRGTKRTVYLAWINYPGRRTLAVDPARYDRARRAVSAYWEGRLAGGHADRRPGAPRQRRLPEPADPEPASDVALQHRQPVRAVLLPGERRRRRGARRARLPGGHARRSCARR